MNATLGIRLALSEPVTKFSVFVNVCSWDAIEGFILSSIVISSFFETACRVYIQEQTEISILLSFHIGFQG